MRLRSLAFATLSIALACSVHISQSPAAIITTHMYEQFEDGTLHPVLTAHNNPNIGSDVVNLDGSSTTTGLATGFTMSIASFTGADGGNGPEGGGPNTSWMMEATIPPVGPNSDGMGAAPQNNDVLFSFNGRYGLRFNTTVPGGWKLFFRPAAGGSDLNSVIPNAADFPTAGSHIALVFTNSGASDTLAYYKDGVLKHSVTGDFNRFNTNNAGFGLEVNTGANIARGFNGTFNAIAFSTFEGTFDPGEGDQFAIPEPSSWVLAAMGLLGLAWIVRYRLAG